MTNHRPHAFVALAKFANQAKFRQHDFLALLALQLIMALLRISSLVVILLQVLSVFAAEAEVSCTDQQALIPVD